MPQQNNNNHRRQQNMQPIDNTYAHLQPQAPEVEKAVLGALMIDRDAYALYCERLSPESFYEPRNQLVFAAIRDLANAEQPIDMLTVTDQLAKNGTLTEVGGPGYVTELSSRVASSANTEYHANVVAQKALFRQFIAYAKNIETKAFDETTDPDDLMQEAEDGLYEMGKYNIRKDVSLIKSFIGQSVKRIQNAAGNKDGLTGVPSGYYRLDDQTLGWQASELTIIAGRPAMGKTAFALSMAVKIAIDQKIPTAFFSLEMSGEQLADRLLANVCEIDLKKIRSGQLTPDEWLRLDKRVNLILESPLYVDDTSGISISEFRAKAKKLVREHDVKIIFVDYLQLMNVKGEYHKSRQEEVASISRSLKGVAKDLNIPILALSQLNRGVEHREGLEGKRPQLSDLRESGSIEQDADNVLFVHRPDYYHIYTDDNGRDLHGMAQIILAKYRQGATDDVLLKFRGEFVRFENSEDNLLQQFPIELKDYDKVPF